MRRGTRARWRGLCDRQAVVACAKSGEARLRGGGRWWRRKAAAFERGAWAAGGEAGVEASGQAGEACGVACGAGAGVVATGQAFAQV